MEDELDAFLAGNVDDTSAVETAETDAPALEHEQPGADAAAETDQPEEGEQPKPKGRSAQDRIDELTRARREAERERDYYRGLAEGRSKPQEQPQGHQPQDDAEPDPAKYTYGETDPGYIRDLGKFTARQEFQRLAQEQAQRNAVQTVEQTWEQRQAAFAKDKPDYYEAVNSPDLAISPAMADAIKTSEDGAAVAYHLAQNPAEARRIAAMHPLAQIRELGKLEAKLATPAAAPTPQPKTVSDAPPPAPQARGLSGRFSAPPDTDDLEAFERTFFAGR